MNTAMVTRCEYSIKTEAKRLIHCAHQMAVGFYRVNNFIVLPYTPRHTGINIVTFPNLSYNKIGRFWEKVKRVQISDFPMKIDAKLVDNVSNLLENSDLAKANFLKTKKIWGKAEDEIINSIYKLIPSKKGLIKKIIIYPTSFGTGTSFNRFDPKKGEIIMYLRQDKGIYTITEAIITSLTRDDVYKNLGGIWQESEIITDWILTKSSLTQDLQKYAPLSGFMPTLKGVRAKQQAKLLAESEEFYKKIGLPIQNQVFNLNGLTPEIYKKPVENLSAKEKILLRLLVQKAGGVITFDEIGENLFEDDNNFSLYAISKTIERLRSKLEQNGISGSYIQTLRGQGYVLKN